MYLLNINFVLNHFMFRFFRSFKYFYYLKWTLLDVFIGLLDFLINYNYLVVHHFFFNVRDNLILNIVFLKMLNLRI